MKNLQAIFLTAILTAVGAVVLSDAPAKTHAAPAESFGKCAIQPFNRAFQAAAAVFRGKVVRAEKNGDVRTFDFEVEEFWKGKSGRRVRIDVYETARFQAWFKKGEEYLVYGEPANDEKANPRVSRCSRSRSIEMAAEDLKQLGRGKSPQ